MGTVTPGVRLDVHGTNVLQQLNGTTTNNAYLDFQNAGVTQWRIGNQYAAAVNRFSIYNAAGTTEVFTILQGGAVGIGVTTPAYLLTIGGRLNVGAGASNLGILFTDGLTAFPSSLIQCSISALDSASGYPAGSLFFQPRTGVAAPIGNLGIGYTAPNLKLSVSGSVYQGSNTANSNFQMLCAGNFYTGAFSPNFTTYTANITISVGVGASNLNTGYVFKTAATITVNLPAASGINNQFYFVVLTGTTVTVNRAGSDNIINTIGTTVTSLTLVGYTKVMLYCDGGTTWYQLF